MCGWEGVCQDDLATRAVETLAEARPWLKSTLEKSPLCFLMGVNTLRKSRCEENLETRNGSCFLWSGAPPHQVFSAPFVCSPDSDCTISNLVMLSLFDFFYFRQSISFCFKTNWSI